MSGQGDPLRSQPVSASNFPSPDRNTNSELVKGGRRPWPSRPRPTASPSRDAGIGIVNCGNTRRVEEPRLSQKVGGLSGPALFAATLDSVRRLRDRFGTGLEIIACGGIDAPAKACRALSAGANACAYFTGFVTRGPILARLILDALLDARK